MAWEVMVIDLSCTPKVHIMSQDITPTAPPMHAYNLSVTMYIADNITKTIFTSANLDLKGVGKNPTKHIQVH